MAGKGLMKEDGMDKMASDSTPKGMKTLDTAPGGGVTTPISGPKIHGGSNKGGDLMNQNGVDPKTTTESP